jgi:hypothetical protein
MKNNKPSAWWLGNSIISLIIVSVSMFLMSTSIPPHELDFFLFYFSILFGVPAFFLSLFLLFILDWGLNKLWDDALDVKILGFCLIISALFVPFIWANRVGMSQIPSPLFPWWMLPLSASLILLLGSSISFAWIKRAEHKAKKA